MAKSLDVIRMGCKGVKKDAADEVARVLLDLVNVVEEQQARIADLEERLRVLEDWANSA